MGRQTVLRDKRKVNFELDTKDFLACYKVMSRHGLTISEFGREAFVRYAQDLEMKQNLPPVEGKISLALDDITDEIIKSDPFKDKQLPPNDPDSADARVRKLI